ncbi:SGNH/GDSL hydrolase family protein [Mycolicibacterium flavescens]|uniref:Lysophospholipase n=1 Tax=Mycolicibacterium flavescens TaxID=1776 RepID=A0A1E3RC32_MYCFV|nr:SGNH/GDSL hydrolase family protein [Mycolicibacterium flavescens]MCV7279138.1 SGNH/GDSL hydrolase family protein [Mycolicibacterium flavescens]ODQ86952.1 lysophospholipase [Mycolicibacterium flavescens]
MTPYSRYVAIGDSQTEGLWDGDDSAGLLGFADRLAAVIDQHRPGLLYANLAVRGRRIRDVLDEQLPQALAMRPDLVTVCVGMNDVTRPGRRFDRALTDLDEIYARLAGSGATVATTTFPDLTRILPVGRLIAARVEQINHRIRAAADRHGFRLVDLYNAPSMTDLDTWSDDRVHGSPRGHRLFTAAAVEALELPGGNHDWASTSEPPQRPSIRSQAYSQLLWTRNLLMPWVWRHLRNRSSGDGREPKRPRLLPLDAQERQRDRGDAVSDR